MTAQEFEAKLAIFARGVDALRGTKQHATLAPLLASDLQLYRSLSGLSDAFPEQRLKIVERALANNRKKLEKIGSTIWGQWHRHALNYSPEKHAEEVAFIQKLLSMLPCGECKQNAEEYMNANPPGLGDRIEYFDWTVAFHNHVNLTKENPTREFTVQEAMVRWSR